MTWDLKSSGSRMLMCVREREGEGQYDSDWIFMNDCGSETKTPAASGSCSRMLMCVCEREGEGTVILNGYL
jgi:hypothetical protein